MTRMPRLICAALTAMFVSAPAWADHGRGDHEHWNKHAKHVAVDRDDCYFHERDVRVISEYYGPQYRRLPPGLAKKYYRTGHLPPGWQKKVRPFPVAVERQLVVLPPHYRRGIIDGNAVVYDPRTEVVIDVFAVFRR